MRGGGETWLHTFLSVWWLQSVGSLHKDGGGWCTWCFCCYDNKHENRLKGGRVYLGSWPQVFHPKAAASSALGSW